MNLMSALIDRQRRPRHESRSVFAPAGTLDQPSEAWVSGLTGLPGTAGVTVTPRTAEGIPTVFACDRVIKQDVAKAAIEVKRLNADGTRQTDPNHPVYAVLHDRPNPVMTAYEFKETMQSNLNLWGNAYAQVLRKGRDIQLWPLEPARMTVDFDDLNRLRYTYRMASGQPTTWIFDPAAPPVFHLRQNTLNGIHGRSPVTVLREQMGSQLAGGEYESRFYGQGGMPSTTLTTDAKLTAEAAARIKRDYESITSGRHNWHRPVILDHGLKPAPNAYMSNRDAQFLELMKLGQSAICGAYRVAPHKIAQLDRATFSNIEHQSIEHVGDCLLPHFVCWQQAIARDLLNPISMGTHFAQFDVKALIQGDFASLNAGLNTMRQNGVITSNDWLREIGSDEVISDADGGDLHMINGAMVPLRRDPAASIDGPVDGLDGMTPKGGVQ
jgi:HK97 family phage portal protein